MAPLEWSEKYFIGIPELDQQHEVLFSGVNAIIQAVAGEIEESDLMKLFNVLLDCTRTHFKDEERIMEEAAYPGLAVHRTSHHHLFDEVTRLMLRARAQQETLRFEVVPLLRAWLVDHILSEDLNLARFIRAQAHRRSPADQPGGLTPA